MGVDHRVYRDVIEDLIGAAGIGKEEELCEPTDGAEIQIGAVL